LRETPAMFNIKKWSYIHKIYNECSRGSILRSFFALNKIRENYQYWIFLGLYLSVSIISLIIVLLNKSYFFVSVFTIVSTALLIRYFIEKSLSKDLNRYYEPNGISEYPFFLRARYLSYVVFKKKLEEDQVISENDIESLIAWDEIGNEEIDRTVFFKSKWFLAVTSAIFGFIVQYFLGLKLGIKELLLITLILLIILWLAFMVFDFSTISKERRLNINRFLKWFQIGSKKT
jgi:hypothetical protein